MLRQAIHATRNSNKQKPIMTTPIRNLSLEPANPQTRTDSAMWTRQLATLFATFLVGALLLHGGRVQAQSTYTWDNSNVTGTPELQLDWFTGGLYNPGTWLGGNPVSSNLSTIQFFENTTTALTNTAVPSSQTVNLNNGESAFEIGTLTLSGLASATTGANLTMTLLGDPLNFSGATGTINLDALNDTGTITYNANNDIQLGTTGSGSALTVGGAGTGTFVLGGTISELQTGGGSLIKNGNSAVSLTGENTFSGGVALNAGTLRVGNAAALGTGTFMIAGGTLDATTAVTLNNNVQNWNGNFAFTGSNALNLGTGTVALGAATRQVTVNASTLTVGGVISGTNSAAGLTKAGTGTLSLDAANTYTGVTTVSGGVLLLNNANALPGGIGATGGTSNLTFNDSGPIYAPHNAVVGLTSDFTRSLGAASDPTAVTFAGNGGWAAFGADRTVNLGGNATPSTITWATANTGFNGKILFLGAPAATHTVELINPIDLGSDIRRLWVGNGSAAIDAKVSGNITGSGTLTPYGLGTLLLTGSNSFGSLNTSIPVIVESGDALGSGTVSLNARLSSLASISSSPISVGNLVSIGISNTRYGVPSLGQAGLAGDIEFAGGLDLQGSFDVLGPSTFNITGSLSGSGATITVADDSTLRLGHDNSGFTGPITVKNTLGTLVIGHAKALGDGVVRLNNVVRSEVDLTGTNALTNVLLGFESGEAIARGVGRAITFEGTNSIEIVDTNFWGHRYYINNMSGGSLVFSGTVELLRDPRGGTNPIYLNGSGNTTFSGNIIDSEENLGVGIRIQDSGVRTFSGTNTYSGTTSVEGGILVFQRTQAKAPGDVTAAAAGAIGLGVRTSDVNYYSAADVGALFNTNSLAGFNLNAVSGVAIDTTNAGGSFDQTDALTAARTLTKLGTGTLILSQANTYSGATNIKAGTLKVTGSLTNEGGVTVNGANAKFIYNGITPLTGDVTVTQGTVGGTGDLDTLTVGAGAIHAPGNSPGMQVVATQNWVDGGTYQWEIQNTSVTGTLGTDWDYIDAGNLDLTGLTGATQFTIAITAFPDGTLTAPAEQTTSTWNILEYDSLTGGFDPLDFLLTDIDFDSTWDAVVWTLENVPGDGTTGVLQLSAYNPIPEPSTMILAGLGLAGLSLRRRR